MKITRHTTTEINSITANPTFAPSDSIEPLAIQSGDAMTWTPADTPPPLTLDEFYQDCSESVLVWDGVKQRIAIARRYKSSSETSWISDCSEGWQLSNIQCWRPLPPPPSKSSK